MSRNKVMEFVLLYALLLSGCAGIPLAEGDVLTIGAIPTATGLYSALRGANPFAHAIIGDSGKIAFVAWPGPGDLWSGVCLRVNCHSIAAGQGFATTASSMSKLMDDLKATGWREIAPPALTVWQAVGVAAGVLTDWIVVPVIPALLPEEEQT